MTAVRESKDTSEQNQDKDIDFHNNEENKQNNPPSPRWNKQKQNLLLLLLQGSNDVSLMGWPGISQPKDVVVEIILFELLTGHVFCKSSGSVLDTYRL